MRSIVACASCRRQFDASDWDPGARFRCHCGEVVVVAHHEPHDAAVVRCSACGAARAGDAASCGHCGSSFSLRDRELDAMCPGCFARISGKARFCHHCGTAINTQALEAAVTDLPCPACGPAHALHGRRLSSQDHTGMECRNCAGLWIDHQTFDHFVSQSRRQAVLGLGADAATRTGVELGQAGPAYRKCVRCGSVMNRQNYGKRSNVIIDVCRQHGVWFDADELARILRWVQAGGHERSARHDSMHADLARKEREIGGYTSQADDLTTDALTLGLVMEGLSGLLD